MGYVVTGSPLKPFVDAVKARLDADALQVVALLGAAGKITGHIDAEAALELPYIVLGRRSRTGDAGAMQLPGSMVSLQIDVFSAHKGPSEASRIQAWIATRLNRSTMLAVAGFDVVQGSLTIELEEVFDEPDSDMPDRGLIYHGVQRLVAEIHEAS